MFVYEPAAQGSTGRSTMVMSFSADTIYALREAISYLSKFPDLSSLNDHMLHTYEQNLELLQKESAITQSDLHHAVLIGQQIGYALASLQAEFLERSQNAYIDECLKMMKNVNQALTLLNRHLSQSFDDAQNSEYYPPSTIENPNNDQRGMAEIFWKGLASIFAFTAAALNISGKREVLNDAYILSIDRWGRVELSQTGFQLVEALCAYKNPDTGLSLSGLPPYQHTVSRFGANTMTFDGRNIVALQRYACNIYSNQSFTENDEIMLQRAMMAFDLSKYAHLIPMEFPQSSLPESKPR